MSYNTRIEHLFKQLAKPQKLDEYVLPYKYTRRQYQIDFRSKLNDYKRAIAIWPRRAGKDKECWNYCIEKAWETIGPYYYIFPKYAQGKKAIWEGRDNLGISFLDHIPPEILLKKNDSELKVTLTNGSIIRIVGSDDIDALMGTSPKGCVFSEYSLQNSRSWDYIRPILVENGGWAIFNYTPRGKNHGWDLKLLAESRPHEWHISHLTWDDIKHISQQELENERQEMSPDIFEQEYFTSFTKGQDGSFYGRYLSQCDIDGRICRVPYDPYLQVDTFWDIGVGDPSAIIFAQRTANEIHIIDYHEMNNVGLDYYANILAEKKYRYGTHWAPHDIKVREFASGARTRKEIAQDQGIYFEIVPDVGLFDGIELSRQQLSKCWFDDTKCKHLLKCLNNYTKKYNEQYNCYSNQPIDKHWSKHGSDAFRMMAVAYSHEDHHTGKTLQEIEMEDNRYRRRFG